jgi:hypothetical protein
MTKKAAPSGMYMIVHQPVKICFERIIPDNMDPERSVRRALREHMVASAHHTLKADELAHLPAWPSSIPRNGNLGRC